MGPKYQVPDPDAPGQMMLVEQQPDGSFQEVVGSAPAPSRGPSVTALTGGRPEKPEKPEKPDAPPSGYQWTNGPGSSLAPIPGGPADKPEKPGGTEGGVDSAKARADAVTGFSSAQSIRRLVSDLRQKFKAGPGATSGVGAVQDYLPTVANRDFDAASNSLRGFVGSALGFTGGQLNSVAEAEMSIGPYLPKAGDYDDVIEGKIARLEQLANDAETRSVAMLGGRPDANGRITPVAEQKADNEIPGQPTGANDKPPPPGMIDSSRGTLAPITGDTKRVPDEKANSKINAFINAGAWTLANQELQRLGRAPITPAERKEIEAWKRKYPNQRYNASDIADVKPVTTGDWLLNNSFTSPIATAAASYANAATAGTAGALAGDEGQGQLAAARAMSPNAALLGDVGGAVTGALGAEAAIGARLAGMGVQNAAKWAPRLGDTAFGAATGFNNAQDGQGLQGALTGAGVGLLGGAAGRAAVRGVGGGLRGIEDASVGYLQKQGIPLTVGQTVGNAGPIGAAIKKIEDAATGTPFVGSMVDSRRIEGLEAFNRAAMQAAAPPGAVVTDTGAAGMAQVRQATQDAYQQALDPATIDVAGDPQLLADISGAQLRAMSIPQVGEDAADALTYRIDGGMDATGAMSGRDFQEAYRGLGRDGRGAANGSYANEFAGVTRSGQDALGEALERQNPGAFQGFLEANAAHRRGSVIADALKTGTNQADELITPAQLNRADVTSTSRLEGKINSAAGNRPFYDLATAGQSVLPSRLPDSGTWTRALVGGGLPVGVGAIGGGIAGGAEGAGTGAGLGLGSMLMLAAGGSKPAQKLLVNALTKRPDAFRVVGDRLVQNAQIGGRLGSGLGASVLTPLLVGP